MRRILLTCLLLGACASPAPHGTWRADDVARLPPGSVTLVDEEGNLHGRLEVAFVRELQAVKARVDAVADIQSELLIIAGAAPNAFAMRGRDNKATVAINMGMLKLLGQDWPAYAFLFGHETVHLKHQHGSNRKAREKSLDNISSVATVLLGVAGVPAPDAITLVGRELASAAYDRDEEREADAVGVEWAMAAGYDPEGAIRLQEKLMTASRSSTIPFLSTHPQGSERIAKLRAIIARKGGADPAPEAAATAP